MELVPEFTQAFEDFLRKANISGEIERQVTTAKEFLYVPVTVLSSEET